MYRRILIIIVSLSVSVAVSQELKLGKNLGRTSMIMAEVTIRFPLKVFEHLKRGDVQEELKLSAGQLEAIASIRSSQKSFNQLQKEQGLDGSLETLGNLSEDEALDLQKKLIVIVDKQRAETLAELDDTLKERQSKRLSELLIQQSMLHGHERWLPEFSVPLPVELTREQRRELQQAVYMADLRIRKQELVKLKYRFYKQAFDDVLGEGKGEEFFGEPFGFKVDEMLPKRTGNPRRGL